ncbi:MAG: cell envelope integrity protein TolA [Bdellovibrionales bacterium]|nr:cell envelope integrity protein TolA [Bdellovibrionales bacterium]
MTMNATFDDLEPKLFRFLQISAVLHLGAILLFVIKSLVFPSKPITYTPSLRVDLVGLPDILKKDKEALNKVVSQSLEKALKEAETQAKAQEKPAPEKIKITKEIANPDDMILNPTKTASSKDRAKKMKSALERIKALQKIEKEEENVVIKGNKLSKGSSLDGNAKENAEANYRDLVRDRLRDGWELAPWLARQNLQARVEITIDGKGRVRSFRFIKASGNSQFDEAVKRSIAQAQPFPTPPKGMADQLLIDGILVGFPL